MSEPFGVGVNYWPAATAMRWWRRFDEEQLSRDFASIRRVGGEMVRFFLLWEDFQPGPGTVAEMALRRLVSVADTARRYRLRIIPTLFTGHMSGANFIPPWALAEKAAAGRFRVVAGDGTVDSAIRNWYSDEGVGAAQELLARECARALAGHEALWGWDLGNENSNCCVPPDRDAGLRWLDRMGGAVRDVDASCHITLGLHMEDLEEDRRIGPAEAATVCDVLSMHAYPVYTRWAAGPVDDALLGFATDLVRCLGGKDVLFAEFGAPTRGDDPEAARAVGSMLLPEAEAAEYLTRAMTRVHLAGAVGGLLWCHADYARSIWKEPPLDGAPHERHFGIFRSDGMPKPGARVLGGWHGRDRLVPATPDWARELDADAFYRDPKANLKRLYGAARAEMKLARPVL